MSRGKIGAGSTMATGDKARSRKAWPKAKKLPVAGERYLTASSVEVIVVEVLGDGALRYELADGSMGGKSLLAEPATWQRWKAVAR